ncbi:6-phosphofructokinase [Merdimmobilis hominis]|uniref:ATP-dependent 6-phosphofructokinase n=1 Tax=uncultured Anaerotruncus sp. TaxID=905011 RepID=A0A6N2S7D3_9FIRM|nr:6-phosphofructokinase [Merdimmobilis hominis]MCD4836356.1 6-phosphofructokinase [Merdimmobilis hominis]PWL63837.1 MAG: 6-phosphofructokinase [Oscillospiraceae bacterium]
MSREIRTIGVLTSGGDAPGMNAAVRAVARAGIYNGFRVMGIRRGYSGLIQNDMEELHLRSVCNILQRGGTMLYSARCPEFMQKEGQEQAVRICREQGIDALVVIGGDGSFRGALELSKRGIPCVGIPGTIDNDIAGSEYTIGFDTAVNTVMEMVDRLRDTSQSHDRCSIVEVMGRKTGHIALAAGIACGAIAILVPEIEFDLERDVVSKMLRTMQSGKHHFIVIVAEGVGNTAEMGYYIQQRTGIATRGTILGHVQRGGTPTARERLMASQMGDHAVDLLKQGQGDRVVVYQNGVITDLDIKSALKMRKTIDLDLYRVANEISM